MARTDIAYDMYRFDLDLRTFQVEPDFAVGWEDDVLVFPEVLEVDKIYNVTIPMRYSKGVVTAKGFDGCYFYLEGKDTELKAYQLPIVSMGVFAVHVDSDNILHIANAGSADFKVDAARHQNSLMTLICIPGNYHRYPTSGVGLYRFLHDRTLAANFGAKVQDEFVNDAVTVTDLKYDYTTGEIDIRTRESED